jgi:hypothetical protein
VIHLAATLFVLWCAFYALCIIHAIIQARFFDGGSASSYATQGKPIVREPLDATSAHRQAALDSQARADAAPRTQTYEQAADALRAKLGM